jgi:hypothetical protein
MDNNQRNTEARQKALNEMLERGSAFEELVRIRGWEYITAYIQNQIRLFTNKALIEGFKNQEEYQYSRGFVAGLRALMGEVDSTLQQTRNEVEKNKQSTTK